MNNRNKIAAGMAGFASMLWLGLTAAVAANQRRLVFNPTVEREVERPRSSGHRTRPVVLRAKDGTRLCGWLMTPMAPGKHPAVIYFGGRSEEVSWVVRDAGKLFPGMAVLAVNYRGYGESHGVPAEIHMIEDGCMLFDWMAGHDHVDARRIAVVGRSLGSGVAVQVAKERPARSVVLITPYDSILAIAKRKFRVMPIEYMLRHRFESIKYAPSLKAPTYVLRAASDDVVPHSHTDQLVAKLAQLCGDDVVPGSDHMNIPYLEATQTRIARFLTAQFAMPIAVASVADAMLAGAAALADTADTANTADTAGATTAAPRLPAPSLLPTLPLAAK
jgi:dipeptidyl aminopeptidase/acylaminoacyl peptidase